MGLFESEVEQRVSPLYAQYPDTDTTILATSGGIQLHPSIWSDDSAGAEARLDELGEAHGARPRREFNFDARGDD